MRVVLLVVVLSAVACGGHGECPPGQLCTAPPDITDTSRCFELPAELQNAVFDTGTCVDDTDCTVIGGQFDFPTCNCAPFALDCSGFAIGRNAPGLQHAMDLIQEMAGCDRSCDGPLSCVCDCSPATAVHCSGGLCFTQIDNQCFGDPPPPPPDSAILVDAAI